MEYTVLYRSEGLLSGKNPGDKVTITDTLDADKLVSLGVVKKAAAPKTEPKEAPKTEPKPATIKPAAKAATK